MYLVAYAIHQREQPSFLEAWTRAIKGEYDHVEITFVKSNRTVYSCYITLYTEVARFTPRNFSNLENKGKLTWFRLRGISPAQELELESKCRTLVQDADYYLSYRMMIMTAFPCENEDLMRYWYPLIEPDTKTKGKSAYSEEFEKEKKKKKSAAVPVKSKKELISLAWQPHQRMTFCGALCAEILGLANPHTYTATDIVVHCQRALNAEIVDQPLEYTPTSLLDEASIVRSSFPLTISELPKGLWQDYV